MLVFTRPGGGHVGFYVGEDAAAYHILGGNQGDAVTIVRIVKSRYIARRWPEGRPVIGKPVPIAQKDWAPFVADLRKASAAMLKAAQAKNKELASDTTNDVAGACENCHSVYRDADPRCTPK